MTTSDRDGPVHPLEQLEAYALNALDELETVELEFHLDECPRCRRAAAQLQATAGLLSGAPELRTPPARLRSRLMRAVEPPPAAPAYAVAPPPARSFWFPAARFLLPVAAAVVVGLLTASLVMNVQVSERTGSVERENATLTAEMALSEDRSASMAEALRELQSTHYWVANPANMPVALKPPQGPGHSEGILLVAHDGHDAVVLLSGMGEDAPSSTYQVWLMRSDDRVHAGTVEVDHTGWGSTMIKAQEPVLGFDKVGLVMEDTPGVAAEHDDMVLEADIRALRPSQMVVYPGPW